MDSKCSAWSSTKSAAVFSSSFKRLSIVRPNVHTAVARAFEFEQEARAWHVATAGLCRPRRQIRLPSPSIRSSNSSNVGSSPRVTSASAPPGEDFLEGWRSEAEFVALVCGLSLTAAITTRAISR
jgi:hypothetical protein